MRTTDHSNHGLQEDINSPCAEPKVQPRGAEAGPVYMTNSGTHEVVVAEAMVSASAVGESAAAGSAAALHAHHPPCQPAASKQSSWARP